MEPVKLTGLSGRSYDYEIIANGSQWNPVPGNYAFIRRYGLNFDVVYIGECTEFCTRPMPPKHERWAEALTKYGATHVLAHVTHGGVDVRRAEERDLIAAYNPPLNVQHRTALPGLLNSPTPVGALGLAQLGRRGILRGG